MSRIVVLAAALALVAVALPAEVSPVGEAAAQCYQIDEFGCFNPCNGLSALVYRTTGRTLYCTE